MAHHKSALKRIRQTEKIRLRNRYYAKTMRTALKNIRSITDKSDAEKFLPKVSSMVDKLANRNVIHKNKADNLKRKIALHVNSLAS
jgi:small subunit ribosomal protein S20